MTHDPTPATTVRLNSLLLQIEQLQSALADQQRVLMRAADAELRTTALRASGLLVRQLGELYDTAARVDSELQAQAKEQRELLTLQDVSAAINSSLDLDVVLQQVMDAIIRLTHAERAMLLLHNEADELEVKIARNLSQETLDDAASLEISRSVVRHVAQTGEPVVTINAQEDERFAAQHSIVSYKLRSILCVPLKIKGEITGVIYADNRIASGIFGDADRDLLASLAHQAAVAIDNARLFREVAGMKRLMDNVFASIASGVITVDDADRIALYNRAAEAILGVPVAEALGQPYAAALAPLGSDVVALVEQVKDGGQTLHTEVELARPAAGSATISLTLSPVRSVDADTDGGVALVVEDVSEKKRLESLRRYLPPALVDRVRDLDAAQRPQRRTITVLFADIRDFSSFGEHMDPEELIHLANGFFSEAVAAIAEQQGLIDKFTGDAVMALFNTPLNPQPDHASRAVRAALRIRDRLAAYHRDLPPAKVLRYGIGIHTGETVVGNVGSSQRKDYSAVGDVVNLCKRLQEMAGSDETLISRQVYECVREDVRVEPLPPVQVKGRQTLEEVFRLMADRAGDADRPG